MTPETSWIPSVYREKNQDWIAQASLDSTAHFCDFLSSTQYPFPHTSPPRYSMGFHSRSFYFKNRDQCYECSQSALKENKLINEEIGTCKKIEAWRLEFCIVKIIRHGTLYSLTLLHILFALTLSTR